MKRALAVNSRRVLDSSVLIAILKDEPYKEDTLHVIRGAEMSSVNYAEVWTKMYDLALIGDSRIDNLFDLLDDIAPFTKSQAALAGDLRPLTRPKGLSLGDRACLALAIERNADSYTAEHRWAELTLPCKIHLIR